MQPYVAPKPAVNPKNPESRPIDQGDQRQPLKQPYLIRRRNVPLKPQDKRGEVCSHDKPHLKTDHHGFAMTKQLLPQDSCHHLKQLHGKMLYRGSHVHPHQPRFIAMPLDPPHADVACRGRAQSRSRIELPVCPPASGQKTVVRPYRSH